MKTDSDNTAESQEPDLGADGPETPFDYGRLIEEAKLNLMFKRMQINLSPEQLREVVILTLEYFTETYPMVNLEMSLDILPTQVLMRRECVQATTEVLRREIDRALHEDADRTREVGLEVEQYITPTDGKVAFHKTRMRAVDPLEWTFLELADEGVESLSAPDLALVRLECAKDVLIGSEKMMGGSEAVMDVVVRLCVMDAPVGK